MSIMKAIVNLDGKTVRTNGTAFKIGNKILTAAEYAIVIEAHKRRVGDMDLPL